jgi:GTP-binding protein Era
MMKDVHASLIDADIILYFIEIEDRREDEFALSLFKDLNKTTFLVINKIDKFGKGKILGKIDYFKDIYPWNEIVPISALKGTSIDLLEDLLYKYLPEGEGFYPEEEYTLQTEKYYVSELIREKVLHHADAELPFATTVYIEEMIDRGKVMYIRADIYVEKHSQKKIIVGKQGNFVKLIGKLARQDLEDYFEKQVYIDLFVKIVPNWRNSPAILSQLEG